MIQGKEDSFYVFVNATVAEVNTSYMSMKVDLSAVRHVVLAMPSRGREFMERSRGIKGHEPPFWQLVCLMVNWTATQLWEGTCNTEIFNQWCRQFLCPLLRDTSVAVLDNAAFHKSKTTRKLIEDKGAKLLFLPPYSPDLNPIEHDFGAIKKIREYNHQKSIEEIIRTYK